LCVWRVFLDFLYVSSSLFPLLCACIYRGCSLEVLQTKNSCVFLSKQPMCLYFCGLVCKNEKNVNLTSVECSEEHSLLSKPFETTTRENQLCLPSQKQPMCLCFCCLMCKKKKSEFCSCRMFSRTFWNF